MNKRNGVTWYSWVSSRDGPLFFEEGRGWGWATIWGMKLFLSFILALGFA